MSAPLDPPVSASPPKRYTAFISYRHGADYAAADGIQRGLQQLTRRWNQRRALEIFRDDTGLSANPALWPSICAAMDGAEWLVLLASPESAGSEWVGKEITRWIATKGADHILTVVTAGTWRWDEAAGDIDWSVPPAENAAHPALRGQFAYEPRHIDMTWSRSAKNISLRDPRFRGQVADLAAPMHGKSKDDLVGEDIRQHKRRQLISRSAVAVLAVLTAIAVVTSLLAVSSQRTAVRERDRAEEQARDATSRRLAALSATVQGPDGALQYLLAAQAYRSAPTAAARGALFNASLGDEGGQAASGDSLKARLVGHSDGIADVAFNPSGSLVATVDGRGALRVWSVDAPKDPVRVEVPGAKSVAFAADDTVVVAAASTVHWYDAATGEEQAAFDAGVEITALAAAGPGGAVVVGAADGGLRTLTGDGREMAATDNLPAPVEFVGTDSAGSTVLAYSSDGTVEVRDAADLTVRSSWRSDLPVVALSPDGELVAALRARPQRLGEGFPVVDVLSAQDGAVDYQAFARELYIPTSAAFRSGTNDLVVGTTGGVDGAPGQAFLHEPPETLETGGVELTVPPTVTSVAVSPDGSTILTAGGEEVAYLNRLESSDLDPVLPLSATVTARRVLVHTDSGLGLADLDTGEVVEVPGDAAGGVVSPDGSVVLTVAGEIVDVATARIVADDLGPIESGVRPVFDGDGASVAYVQAGGGSLHRIVAVADLTTGDVVSGESPVLVCDPTTSCDQYAGTLALSPDGTRLAISSYLNLGVNQAMGPGEVAVVGVGDGWQPGPTAALPGSGPTLFADDGARLLAHDGQRVWDLDADTLEPRGSGYVNEAGGTWTLAPDGVQLAAVEPCGVKLLDPETWSPVADVPWNGDAVEGEGCLGTAASWTADGALLTVDDAACGESTWSSRCDLKVWTTDPAVLSPQVCALAGRNMTREEWSQFLPDWPYELTCPSFGEPVTDADVLLVEAASDSDELAVPPAGSGAAVEDGDDPEVVPPDDEPTTSAAPEGEVSADLTPADAYVALLRAGPEPVEVPACPAESPEEACVALVEDAGETAVVAIVWGVEVALWAQLERAETGWRVLAEYDPADPGSATAPQWLTDVQGGP